MARRLWPEAVKTNTDHGRLAVQYGGNCMSQRRVTNGGRYSNEGGGMLITLFLGRRRL